MDGDELYAWAGAARWSAAVFVAALPGTSAPVPLLQRSSPRLLRTPFYPVERAEHLQRGQEPKPLPRVS